MAEVTGEQKVFAILSYLWILVLIPLLVKKDDEFVHFHAKQGLVWFLVWIVVSIVTMIPLLGWILSPILSLAMFIVTIIAIVQIFMGKKWEIPVVSTWADKINL
jgi:fumarate reductase subunit D